MFEGSDTGECQKKTGMKDRQLQNESFQTIFCGNFIVGSVQKPEEGNWCTCQDNQLVIF